MLIIPVTLDDFQKVLDIFVRILAVQSVAPLPSIRNGGPYCYWRGRDDLVVIADHNVTRPQVFRYRKSGLTSDRIPCRFQWSNQRFLVLSRSA